MLLSTLKSSFLFFINGAFHKDLLFYFKFYSSKLTNLILVLIPDRLRLERFPLIAMEHRSGLIKF